MHRLTFSGSLALLFALAVPTIAQPQTIPVDTAQSTLAYTGSHPLHSWTGTSNAVHGTLGLDLADPAQSTVEIRVPVESFDSGNGNRDSDMLDVVEVDRYPDVRFTSDRIEVTAWEETAEGYQGSWQVTGMLDFHGQEHPITLPVEVSVMGDTFEANSTFEVSLERFEVPRPRLLFMSIRDTIELEGTIRATLPEASLP